MTQTLLQHTSTLRDIRLSVLGFHREERLSPPADMEAIRRKIEHEAYRRGVATATEACEERVRVLREEIELKHREEVGVYLEQLSQKMSSQLAERMEILEKALLQLTVEAVAKIVGSLPITVDVIEGASNSGLSTIVEDLYQYWKPGMEPPSIEELMSKVPKSAEPAAAAVTHAGGAPLSAEASKIPAALLARSQAALAKARANKG